MRSLIKSFKDLRSWKKVVLRYRQLADGDQKNALMSLLLLLSLVEADSWSLDEDRLYENAKKLFETSEILFPQQSMELPAQKTFGQCHAFLKAIEKENRQTSENKGTSHEFPWCLTGDTYQIWAACSRPGALSKIQKADKSLNQEELIAFTQIYTPSWVVDYLVEKTIRRDIEKAKIIDPACGTGNFLLRAFDYMVSSASKAGKSKDFNSRVEHILRKQIHGVDIDGNALQVMALSFAARCMRLGIEPVDRIEGIEVLKLSDTDELGALKRELAHSSVLNRSFDVVLTNPPYIGRKLMSRELKTRLKKEYPESCSDLSSAFLKRCLELLNSNGRFGVITQASVLTLPTYKRLRKNILEESFLEEVVDLGPGVFPNQSGEKINSSLLIFEKRKADPDESIAFFDLKGSPDQAEQLKNIDGQKATKKIGLDAIKSFYGYNLNYQIPEVLVKSLSASTLLGDKARIKQGLATTDNKKFVRYIWEVPAGEINHIWFPYAKGAGSSRWYSPVFHVVDWQDNGRRIKENASRKYPYLGGRIAWVVKNESYYFKPGLVFSFVNKNGLCVRKLPPGCIFDVGASAIFSDEIDNDFLLGYLNSAMVSTFMKGLNPTINNQVGDLKKIPFLNQDVSENLDLQLSIAELARKCYQTKKALVLTMNPIGYYLKDQKMEPTSIHEQLEAQRDISDCFRLLTSRVSRLKGDLNNLEQELDEAVFKLIKLKSGWSSSEEAEIRKWLARQSQKKTRRIETGVENELTSESQALISRKQFAFLYIFDKKFHDKSLSANQIRELECFMNKSVDRFLESDYRDLLDKAFQGSPPDCESRLAALSDI